MSIAASFWLRVRWALKPTLITAAAAFVLPLGCSSEEGECAGVTAEGGACEKKCNPAQCLVAGSTCFRNACASPCNGHDDCPIGKNCVGLIADDGKTQGNYCYTPDFAKDGSTGQYEPCQANEDCDQARGFACVDGECRIAGCRVHADCVAVGTCAPGGKLPDGATVNSCIKGQTYPEGQYGTACPGGAAAKECDEESGFTCIGAGPGDVDAYCTGTACTADSECPSGYFCSSVRTSRAPCQDACGFTGQPTATNCVPAADIGPGKAYSCGPLTLLRNLCLKRQYCNECESDADCMALPDQICAKDVKGNKKCTVLCDPNISNACPWGNASDCQVWDKDVGVPTCAHRFGDCKGTGKSCEPCVDDGDCPTGLCLQSDFTQEKYCVDLGASCACGSGVPLQSNAICQGGGCPQTPGGLTMNCYGGPAVQAGGSPLYQKCVGANVQSGFGSSPQTGCWPKL